MKLTWYGHSCFLLDTEDGSVVFDPYAPGSVLGLTLPPLAADAVLCSHEHRDHGYAHGVKNTRRMLHLKIERIPSFHDDCGGLKRGDNLMSVVEAEGKRVAHLGDLGHMLTESQLEALGRVDILMIPVGGYFTIDAAVARQVADAIRAPVVIPMHYRGDGFGHDELAPVDAFLALSQNVRYFDSASLTQDQLETPMTAVLKCPTMGV